MQRQAALVVLPDNVVMPRCRVAGDILRHRERVDRKLGPWSVRLIEGLIRDWPDGGGGGVDVRCPRDLAQGIGTRDGE